MRHATTNQKIVLDIRLHAESIRDEHRKKETCVTPRFEGEIYGKLNTAKKHLTKDIKKSNRMTKHLITGSNQDKHSCKNYVMKKYAIYCNILQLIAINCTMTKIIATY